MRLGTDLLAGARCSRARCPAPRITHRVGRVVGVRTCVDSRVDEARSTTRFSVTFVAANDLRLGGFGQCVQKCFSLDNKLKENDMSKRGRKRRDRRKHGANHGKRPNA